MTQQDRSAGDSSARRRGGPPAAEGGDGVAGDGERAGTISRRQLLARAGGGAAAVVLLGTAGGLGYEWSRPGSPDVSAATTPHASDDVLAFRSRPDLSPPRVQVTRAGADDATGLFLTTPNRGPAKKGVGQQGAMLTDAAGDVVWFHPVPVAATDLQVQSYQGKPVLTWWQGVVTTTGHGVGTGVIYDTSYRQVATIPGGNGLQADLHELVLTGDDTALVTAYGTETVDLSSVGGPKSADVLDGVVLEIDVATGKVLFEWHSLDHVALIESHALPPTLPFDYFHVNSIAVDPNDGNLVVSARNTWAVYKIDRSTGAVMWRLGGKRSDFAMGKGASFAWQHHARRLANGEITLFDDGASPAVEPESRAIVLALDESAKKATLVKQFTHPAHLLAANQGSFELLADGGAVVGWGAEPYFSQFAPDGALLIDARFPTNDQSYRAFRSPWTGTPTTAPDIAVERDAIGNVDIYASWNGATEVSSWQVLAGKSPSALAVISTLPKAGFETSISAVTTERYVAVEALDAHGHQLGRSRAVAV